jgi:hypothetical protein
VSLNSLFMQLRLVKPVPLPTIQPLSSFWEPETTAVETAFGGPGSMTAGEKYALDDMFKYMRFGFAGDVLTKSVARAATAGGLYFVFGTEARFMVNLLKPGTFNLTKNGNPTFTAYTSVAAPTVSDFYGTGIPFNAVPQNDVSIICIPITNNAGVGNGYDAGVISDASGSRLSIMVNNTGSTMAGACMSSTNATILATTDFSGSVPKGFSRTAGASYDVYNTGARAGAVTNASIAATGVLEITLLKANGSAVASQQAHIMFAILPGLTQAEMAQCIAAFRIFADRLRWGMADIQPAGFGDAAASFDAVVFGTDLPGLQTAYTAAEAGASVAIIGDFLTESDTQFGTPVGYADISSTVTPKTSGLFYEMCKDMNARLGLTDSDDQAGRSFDGRDWSIQFCKMCDTSRTGGNIPGRNIKIYLSTGLRSVQKNGVGRIISVTTNDGRVLSMKQWCENGYDGDSIFLHGGLPYTSGREADGTGFEVYGFHIAQRGLPGDNTTSNTYRISPRFVDGDTGSALLPRISPAPTYTEGQAYPALQQNNFRLFATTSKPRRAPLTGGVTMAAPAGYNAGDYEIVGRLYTAYATIPHTATIADVYTTTRAVNGVGSIFDLNNAKGISSDFGGSGNNYLNAGISTASRLAVIKDMITWQAGLHYWHATSGDVRIPAALVTSFLTTWGLETNNGLGRVSWKPLYWPGIPYRREPIWQLNNSARPGGYRQTVNDTDVANGTTPRSVNTVAMIEYDLDHHGESTIAYDDGGGEAMWRQGGFSVNDTVGLGPNAFAPFPFEGAVAVESDCPNFCTATCVSVTKGVFGAYRMERCMGSTAEVLGYAMAMAGSGSIQTVDQAALRANVLAAPRTVPLVLTQTN